MGPRKPRSPTARSSVPTSERPMLRIDRLSAFYGKHQALADINIKVGRAEIVTILGANGAGKTTMLKVIAGLVAGSPGAIRTLDSQSLDGLTPREIVEAGVALVPEGRRLLGQL